MKIAFFEVVDTEKDFFISSFPDMEVLIFENKLTKENVEKIQDVDILSVFVGSVIDKNIIDVFSNLKLITTRSTGFDHIDYEHAKTKGVQVSNVPVYGADTVAEFTFALILSLSRKIKEATLVLKENGDYSVPTNTKGFDLSGKTIGVVGTGKIGKNVVRIANAFKMNILAYDLYPDLEFAKTNNFSYKTLREVLSGSDIVTLHTPYTRDNHHLINQDNISFFKKGAYLINTARGELVDTIVLEQALKNGSLGGAGLDVLEGEKNFKSGDVIPMLEMPNVVMTPHIAFNTKEAEIRIMQTTIENIKNFVAGFPINSVN